MYGPDFLALYTSLALPASSPYTSPVSSARPENQPASCAFQTSSRFAKTRKQGPGKLRGMLVSTSPAQAGLRAMNWRLCSAERVHED